MVSAIAVAGRIGLTAIGDSTDQANTLFQRVKSVFDAETDGTQRTQSWSSRTPHCGLNW